MDANGRQISVTMTSGVLGSENREVFRNPGIRILPLDRMVGDETGGFPGGRGLRREGSHLQEDFWLTGVALGCKKRGYSVTLILRVAILGRFEANRG